MIRVINGPLPGTNRLGSTPFLGGNTSTSAQVILDGCEFGGSFDDAMDIQSSGLNMYYSTATTNPNQMLVWSLYGGLSYKAGDAVSVFSGSSFANVYTANVTDVQPYNDSTPTTTDAANVWNSFGRRNKTGGSLLLVTLDKPVTGTTSGDFIEDASSRMPSFTMTNCYWHQIGVRAMIEGIQQGSFTHNTFDGVNGGLAIAVDPYWAQGGTCQNVTVDNNVFRNCNLTNTQAQGALVLGSFWGSGPALSGQSYAFQNFTVTNNTFTGTGVDAIHAHMVGPLTIAHNLFVNGQGKAIGLYGCGGVTVTGNSVVHNNGLAVDMTDDNGVSIYQNFLDDTASPASPLSSGNSANVTAANNLLSGVYYNIQNPFNSLVAAVQNGSKTAGATLIQNSPANSPDRNWRILPTSAGQYRFLNQNSRLDFLPLGWNSSDGATVGQWGDNLGTDHLWSLLANADGASFRLDNVFSGKVLSLTNNSTTVGDPLTQWDDTGTSDHNWQFVPTATVLPTPTGVAASGGSVSITLSWNAVSGATGYAVYRGTSAGGENSTPIASNVTGTTFTDTGLAYGATYYYTVAAVSAADQSDPSSEASAALGPAVTSYRINAGGGASSPYAADSGFSGGSAYSTASAIDTSAVTNPAPQAVYQTERFGVFTYTLGSLSPGSAYTVRLHFAEIYFTGPNLRQFNVAVNGTSVLTNFDIFAAAGGKNKAIVQTFSATADASGKITIVFTTGAHDSPKVSGLEISGTALAAPAGLTAVPGNGQVNLTWPAVSGAASYLLYRSTVFGRRGNHGLPDRLDGNIVHRYRRRQWDTLLLYSRRLVFRRNQRPVR